MTPVSFGGCFALLHLPPHGSKRTAVVLCPGLKSDDFNGYSGLKLLAMALAKQGYPVLRLHYIGTGNSVDDETEYWTAWQSNLHDAIDWMRSECGVEHIVLCGLRFGAMLTSVVAANRSDVAGLIHLAPVLRGRTYMRQLQTDGYFDVGFRLAPETIHTISSIDLRTVVPPRGSKIIVFAQSGSSSLLQQTVEQWTAAGATVTLTGCTGLDALLRPNFLNHETPLVTEPIIAWIEQSWPDLLKPQPQPHLVPVAITNHDYVETPLCFGRNNSLFGILCRPYQTSSRVVVLMGNSSADPHCASTTVGLARHLAIGGITSLRFDFSGIGDSAFVNDTGSHIFEMDRTPDFSAAIDALMRLGYDEFAVEGLCSGAYHAYHAAMTELRIDYALLINLPFFEWVSGFPVENLVFHARKPKQFVREMQSKVFWINLWERILKGDGNVIRNRFVWLERKLRQVPGFGCAMRPKMFRRVKTLFLISEGDISGEVLKREFGSRPLPAGIEIELVDGLDHSMARANMREVVASRMILFLRQDRVGSVIDPVETAVPIPA